VGATKPAPAAGAQAIVETGAAAVPVPEGRVIVLAIDEASFPVTAQSAAREAAIRVVDRVAVEDYLGMMTFPGQVDVAPTRDHKQIRDAISRIAGARVDASASSRFNLSANEAALLRSRASVSTKEIIDRECNWPPEPSCPQEVMESANAIAIALEQQGMLTIAGLHRALDAMASLPGRKTLMVISAGLPMSTQRGGRPDFEAETTRIASRAAAASVNLYVLYMNVHFLRFFSPAYGKINYSIYADITMFGYGLEKFADSAGGAFFQVEVNSDPFVDRALRETSASYLLAVRAEPPDQDGKEHYIRVSVKARGATIRYRRTVTIPRGGH
jgi:VWFA-related protein